MEIAELIKNIGIPAALLILLVYRVVLPVTDSHISFIKSLEKSIDALINSQKNLSETVNNLSKTIDMIEKKLGK